MACVGRKAKVLLEKGYRGNKKSSFYFLGVVEVDLGFTIAANFEEIVVATLGKPCETIFLGLFSLDENEDVAMPAEIVFPVLSNME